MSVADSCSYHYAKVSNTHTNVLIILVTFQHYKRTACAQGVRSTVAPAAVVAPPWGVAPGPVARRGRIRGHQIFNLLTRTLGLDGDLAPTVLGVTVTVINAGPHCHRTVTAAAQWRTSCG